MTNVIERSRAIEPMSHKMDMEEEQMTDVYDTYSNCGKIFILLVICGCAFLSGFDEDAYVTVLPVMLKDFGTTETFGLLTISIYLFTMSVSSLLWGILSDYCGRKPIIILGNIGIIFSTMGCYYSPNIWTFFISRALQGGFASSPVVVGEAIIADIYHPNNRGMAYGIFNAFHLSATLIAPTVGGLISSYYYWKTNFIVIVVASFVLLVISVIIVPETEPRKVQNKLQNKQNLKYSNRQHNSKPTWTKSYLVLLHLIDKSVVYYAFVLIFGSVSFACCYLLLSIDLAKPPYSYSQNVIGVFYTMIGVVSFLGSIIGGKLSDLVYVKFCQSSQEPEGHIIASLILFMFVPIGLLVYGWSYQYNLNTWIPLCGEMFAGLFYFACRPGIFTFFMIKYQDQAGSIGAAIFFVETLLTAIISSLVAQFVHIIHEGPTFTILSLCNILGMTAANVALFKKIRTSRNSERRTLI